MRFPTRLAAAMPLALVAAAALSPALAASASASARTFVPATCDPSAHPALEYSWGAFGTVTVGLHGGVAPCADVSLWLSSYAAPDDWDGHTADQSALPQTFRASAAEMVFPAGSAGNVFTRTVAVPESCANAVAYLYWGPEIRSISSATPAARYVSSRFRERQACDAPAEPTTVPNAPTYHVTVECGMARVNVANDVVLGEDEVADAASFVLSVDGQPVGAPVAVAPNATVDPWVLTFPEDSGDHLVAVNGGTPVRVSSDCVAAPVRTDDPDATGTTPAPAGTTPDPTGTTPAPAGTTPDPTNPDPTGTTPAPAGTTPAPTGTTPAPASGAETPPAAPDTTAPVAQAPTADTAPSPAAPRSETPATTPAPSAALAPSAENPAPRAPRPFSAALPAVTGEPATNGTDVAEPADVLPLLIEVPPQPAAAEVTSSVARRSLPAVGSRTGQADDAAPVLAHTGFGGAGLAALAGGLMISGAALVRVGARRPAQR